MNPTILLAVALTLPLLSFAENRIPTAFAQPLPEFPNLFSRPSLPVDVTVTFIVDETGAAQQVHVVQSTNQQFEKSATNALNHWRFQPAETNGQKIGARMIAAFTFHADQTITYKLKPR